MAWHTTTAVVFPPKDDRGDSPKRKQTPFRLLGTLVHKGIGCIRLRYADDNASLCAAAWTNM